MESHAAGTGPHHAKRRGRRALAAGFLLALGLGLAGCGSPEIEWSCTMNGFGQGTCSFTNTGDGKGAVCGTIHVESIAGGSAESSKFCSGQVEPASTTSVDFSIPQVRETCDAAGSWTEVCAFDFRPAE